MSMTTQDWQCVEARRDLTKTRQSADPMAYLAVLVVLGAIMVLMSIFCSIGSAERHLSDHPHPSATAFTPDE
jgi:Na+/melibiose symporter-like transporter